MKKDLNKQGGFTLIEILVVIGIIAILATIVLIAINPARQFAQANDTQRTSNVNAILNAVGQYMVDNNGQLPTEITIAAQDVSKAGADICTDLVPTYMPALPVDPVSGTDDANEDGQIAEGECGDAYDTGYTVIKDAAGRVTITAEAEVDLNDDGDLTNDFITVTR